MKLYHVSYDPIPWFVLRVPDHRLPDEDCTTPRICLGDSVENCVNAKPDQATALYLAKQFGVRVPLYVYEFDTEDIPDGALVEPKALSQSGRVSDAEHHHEYWLLDDGVPYQETRYEVIGGGYIPPDGICDYPYAMVMRLRLSLEESDEARRLERAVWEFNRADSSGKYLTTNCVLSNCIEEIAEIVHRARS